MLVEGAPAMEALGARLASALRPSIIWLQGELGAGKTTLVRGMLRAMGYEGSVRSPTYTLVEPYTAAQLQIYHLDLYRLADPEELEWLGLRDMLATPAVLMIEWPERGEGVVPPADLIIRIEHRQGGRDVDFEPLTATGWEIVTGLEAK